MFGDSLLARPDGMYTVEALSTEELEKLEDLKNAQDAIDRTREGIKKERNDEALDRCAGNAGFAIERNGFERASFSWYNQGRKNGVRP